MSSEVQQHFRERAQTYDQDNWTSDSMLLSAHVDVSGSISASRILDIGCGTGVLGAEFVLSGAEVIGVDISSEMLEHARTRLAHSIQANIYDLPFPSERFDLILCRQVLHYIDASLALKECRRVLRSGGHMLVSSIVPYGVSDLSWFMGRVKLMKPLQVWTPTTDSVLDLMKKTGFTLIKSDNVQTRTRLSLIVLRTAYDRQRRNAAFEYHLTAPAEVKAQYRMRMVGDDIEYWTNWIIGLFQKSPPCQPDETTI